MSRIHLTKYLLSISIVFLFLSGHAQPSIGLDLSINKDKFVIRDEGAEISDSRRINLSPGVSYRYLFKKGLIINSGLYFKQFSHKISFTRFAGQSSGNGSIALQLPIIFGQRFELSKKNGIYFIPMLGSIFNYIPFNNSENYINGRISYGKDTITYNSIVTNTQPYYLTLTVGVMLEFKMGRHFSIGLNMLYYTGFNSIIKQSIEYKHNHEATLNAMVTTNGSYWTMWGVKILYSFKKKD